jgi:hypothetical protein
MRGAALTLAVLAALGLGGPALAPARASAAPNPTEDIPMGALSPECSLAPLGNGCEEALIAELDSARAATGLGPYLLPTSFVSLAPDRQLLILTDLDRVAYGLAPVPGLDAELDWSAVEGADEDSDPLPPGELSPGGAVEGYASDWAGGFVNVLQAYYDWMYDDGYPSANEDCTSPDEAGCWGHRQNVLVTFPESEGSLSLGAAAGADGDGQPSYALVIAHTSQAGDYYYTWAEAQEAGAGQVPQANPSDGELEIAAAPLGLAGGESEIAPGCAARCLLAQEPSSSLPAPALASTGAHIAASLAGQLVPPPSATTLTALLRGGSYHLRFRSISAGVVSIRWYGRPASVDRPTSATIASATRRRSLLLAQGSVRFASAGRRTVRLQLTPLGRHVLQRGTPVRLTALGTFTPAGARPVSARRSFTLGAVPDH